MPLLVVPLRHRPPRNAFFFGRPGFLESSRSLVAASLQDDPHSRWSAPDWVIGVLSAWAVPLLVIACVITACVIALRARHTRTPGIADSAVPVLAIGTTLGATVAALAVARLALHLPLPFEAYRPATGLRSCPLHWQRLPAFRSRHRVTTRRPSVCVRHGTAVTPLGLWSAVHDNPLQVLAL